MNILMIHPHDLFSEEEPWTVRIMNIACELKKKGENVKIVFFPLITDKEKRRFNLNGIEFVPLSRRVGLRNLLGNIKILLGESDWADTIHFQKCFYHASLPAILCAYVKNKPVHYDWDDWEVKIFHYSARQPLLIGIFMRVLERFIPLLCDTISVSSRRLSEECQKYKIPKEHIYPAPVGADLEMFHPRTSGVRVREKYNISGSVVTYIGQLHGGQYAEQFIKAVKIVLNQKQNVCFMVVGHGYRLPELMKLSEELDVAKNLIFTRSIPHDEISLYIAAADITIACFEDNDITRCKSPLKIAEYLASGKPIVASDVGEVKYMLGGAGILTLPGDPEDLARGILKLLEDEPLKIRLGKKARMRALDIYNWGNTTDNLLKAYHSMFS